MGQPYSTVQNDLNFRVQHYGEGDKIPQHRYGIYSIEWPKERERLINEMQTKKTDHRSRASSSKAEEMRRYSPPQHRREAQSARPSKFHEFEKRKVLKDKNDDFKNISKIINRALPPLKNTKQNSKFEEVEIVTGGNRKSGDLPGSDVLITKRLSKTKPSTSNESRNQQRAKDSTSSTKNRFEAFSATGGRNVAGDIRNQTNEFIQFYESKPKRYITSSQLLEDVQRSNRLKILKNKIKAETEKIRNKEAELQKEEKRMQMMDKTQGDRLNEIKAIRQLLKKYKTEDMESEQKRHTENTNQLKKHSKSYYQEAKN